MAGADGIGKHARTSALAPVQRHATMPPGADEPSAAEVHAAAARGIASPITSLPHADQIQASFGPDHDVGRTS